MSSPGRTIGPATRCGKKERYAANVPNADGREVAAVHVDDVADRHEREEGDADREEDRARLERHVDADEREEVVRRGDEEVVVLEVAEQAEVPDERDGEEPLPRPLRRAGGGSRRAKTWFQTIEKASRKQKRQSQPA